MPLSRNEGSTSRRFASHSTVSGVGRVLPRSIWLTYSFEKRSPASSVWVSPAATRRRRRRSPRRAPRDAASEAAGEVVFWVAAVISVMSAAYLGSLSEAGSGVERVPLCGDFRDSLGAQPRCPVG